MNGAASLLVSMIELIAREDASQGARFGHRGRSAGRWNAPILAERDDHGQSPARDRLARSPAVVELA